MTYDSLYQRLYDEIIEDLPDADPASVEDTVAYLVEMGLLDYDLLKEYYQEYDA